MVIVCNRIEKRTRRYVCLSEFVVELFTTFKGWHLSGFAEHPDNNKVIAFLSHKNGPIRQGYLERPLPGITVISVTGFGKVMAVRFESKLKELREQGKFTY